MSTPLHVLLKDDPSLVGDVAEDKADPSACHQLCQVPVLQYLQGTAGSMDHQHVFRQWTFLKSSCHSGYTVLANRMGWQVAGDLVSRESPDSSQC